MKLLERITEKARKHPKRVVFPESYDGRVVSACAELSQKGIVRPVLLGKPAEIVREFRNRRLALEGIEIIDPLRSEKRESYAQLLYGLRKHRGMSPAQALALLDNDAYFGTMMLKAGDADALIYGASHPTADTLRPAFQIIKTRQGITNVSGAFLLVSREEGERVFLFADCAVIENPTAQELAEIAGLSAESFEELTGKKARVAMLSYSTQGSGGHSPSIEKVQEAVKLAQKQGLVVDGEMQADAALVKEVCERKCPGCRFPGDHNVFVFPNLDAGNIAYKLVERLGNFEALGPILQGLARQVNDLSRGCSVKDIVDLAAITAVQSQGIARKEEKGTR